MTMIAVKVLADSVSPQGVRLTTIEYTAHRFILAEINTHRIISKNARSSRAVPTKNLIEEVRYAPALPVEWGSNRPGMQAGSPISVEDAEQAELEWKKAAAQAALTAARLNNLNVHKQVVNRVLEPFMWVHGVMSSTSWSNLFDLRAHEDAQPEFRVLATKIQDALAASTPKPLHPGQWHLPYVTDDEREFAIGAGLDLVLKLSVARCARVSYAPFDGVASWEKEIARAEKVRASGHWSPFEHQATPDETNDSQWKRPELHRNFSGWVQYRATVDGQ
jgi:hypothetical protein